VTTDVTPPSVTVSVKSTVLAAPTLSFGWRTSDPSGVSSVRVTVYRDGRPVASRQGAAAGTWKYVGDPAHAYRLGLVAVDSAGNIGGASSSVVRLPYDDRSFATGKGWTRASSRTAFDGSYLKASEAGATATVRVRGTSFGLLTSTGPADGIVAVFVDGKHVRDVSLYSKASHPGVTVVLARFHKAGAHRITLVVKGKRVPHSKGSQVDLDGLIVP
jgi:hypothetical protein